MLRTIVPAVVLSLVVASPAAAEHRPPPALDGAPPPAGDSVPAADATGAPADGGAPSGAPAPGDLPPAEAPPASPGAGAAPSTARPAPRARKTRGVRRCRRAGGGRRRCAARRPRTRAASAGGTYVWPSASCRSAQSGFGDGFEALNKPAQLLVDATDMYAAPGTHQWVWQQIRVFRWRGDTGWTLEGGAQSDWIWARALDTRHDTWFSARTGEPVAGLYWTSPPREYYRVAVEMWWQNGSGDWAANAYVWAGHWQDRDVAYCDFTH